MKVEPNGVCWCGCGDPTGRDSFFRPGNDEVAEAAVAMVEYGGVPELLLAHGYGPDGKNPRSAYNEWREKGKKPR